MFNSFKITLLLPIHCIYRLNIIALFEFVASRGEKTKWLQYATPSLSLPLLDLVAWLHRKTDERTSDHDHVSLCLNWS